MHRKLTTSVKWINSLKTVNYKILNSSIIIKGIKFIVKNLAKKVFLGPDDFTENSTKHLKKKKKKTLILPNLFQAVEMLPSSFNKARTNQFQKQTKMIIQEKKTTDQ